MHRKRDLKIDTDFFDDHLGQLEIPEAILVAPSKNQSFIKSGLNDQQEFTNSHHPMSNDPVQESLLTIQKIMSRILVENFLFCWDELKNYGLTRQHVEYSRHKRTEPIVQNIVTEEEQYDSNRSQEKYLFRQRQGFQNLRVSDGKGSTVEWLKGDRVMHNHHSKQVQRANMHNSSDIQVKRAKVLKQIAQKLKQGKQSVSGMINSLSNVRDNHLLHHKLGRMQRLMLDMQHNSSSSLKFQSIITQSQTTGKNRFDTNYDKKNESKVVQQIEEDEFVGKLKGELSKMKAEMEIIRSQNQMILKNQKFKKEEINKIVQTKEQIKGTYQQVRRQIQELEREKRINDQKHYFTQQESELKDRKNKQYLQQITQLQERVKQLQIKEKNLILQHQQSSSSINSRPPQQNAQHGQIVWTSRVNNPQKEQRVQTQNGYTITNQKNTIIQRSIKHRPEDTSSWVDPQLIRVKTGGRYATSDSKLQPTQKLHFVPFMAPSEWTPIPQQNVDDCRCC